MSLSHLLADNSVSWSVRVNVDLGEFIVGPFTTKSAAREWVAQAKQVPNVNLSNTTFTIVTGFAPKKEQ
jgi:hypothetical protein